MADLLWRVARDLEIWHATHRASLSARQGRRLGRVRRALAELAADLQGGDTPGPWWR